MHQDERTDPVPRDEWVLIADMVERGYRVEILDGLFGTPTAFENGSKGWRFDHVEAVEAAEVAPAARTIVRLFAEPVDPIRLRRLGEEQRDHYPTG